MSSLTMEQRQRQHRLKGIFAAFILFLSGVLVGSSGFGLFLKYDLRWALKQKRPGQELIVYALKKNYGLPDTKIDQVRAIWDDAFEKISVAKISDRGTTLRLMKGSIDEIATLVAEEDKERFKKQATIFARRLTAGPIASLSQKLDLSIDQTIAVADLLAAKHEQQDAAVTTRDSLVDLIWSSRQELLPLFDEQQRAKFERLGERLQPLREVKVE